MIDRIIKQYSRSREKPVAEVITGVTIGDTYNPYGRSSVYVVTVSFMHGDADSYDSEECVFQLGDEERMLEFLNFLARCAVRYCNGKGGYDTYSDVPGYSRWVEDADFNEDDYEDLDDDEFEAKRKEFEEGGSEDQILNWPFWEGEYCASYNGAHVVFFDENGIQKSVSMSTQECQTEKA